MSQAQFYFKVSIWLLVFILGLSACRPSHPFPPAQPSVPTITQPDPTLSQDIPTEAIQATNTPVLMAARVNGEGISLAEYQVELDSYGKVLSKELTPEDNLSVLADLIDQVLLSQGAVEGGFEVEETVLQERTNNLIEQLGSQQKLDEWIQNHGYNAETFQLALKRAVAGAWMRDQIIAEVSAATEQVHARQILLYESGQTEEILSLLKGGNDFGNLALKYDPITGGDLGWFPRGYLPDQSLEEAAFKLQENEFSPVIETLAGFHILQVLERDSQHPLSPEALLILQGKAVQDWLKNRRETSEIQILLP